MPSWITSQNDTAPKLDSERKTTRLCWITSQNDTAPKLLSRVDGASTGWITSQNDTAPKLPHVICDLFLVGLPVRTTLLQNLA